VLLASAGLASGVLAAGVWLAAGAVPLAVEDVSAGVDTGCWAGCWARVMDAEVDSRRARGRIRMG